MKYLHADLTDDELAALLRQTAEKVRVLVYNGDRVPRHLRRALAHLHKETRARVHTATLLRFGLL